MPKRTPLLNLWSIRYSEVAPLDSSPPKPARRNGFVKLNWMKRLTLMLTLVALLLQWAGLSLHAREGRESPSGKWRPKEGSYAEPGPEFDARCGEYGDARIDWSTNFISGGEGGCNITKISDVAPGNIRLDVGCYSAQRGERSYKETILLKKIDEKTIFFRETQDGKFRRSGGPMAYCPDELQMSERTKQQAEEEKALKGAHPRDGVYAASGADFDERCAKFDDTLIAFSGKSITTASNICRINNTRVQLPDTVRIGADCTLRPASGADAASVQNVDTTPDRENLMFKKIDDKTVILWIIKDGHFTGDGRKLSYCSDQVQRAYAGQGRAGKQTRN